MFPTRVAVLLLLVAVSTSLVACQQGLESESQLTHKKGDNITCVIASDDMSVLHCELGKEEVEYESADLQRDPVGSSRFWVDLSACIFLVLMAGFMSGLTMGLLALDITTLRILSKSGTPAQKGYAAAILPLVKRHHLLLVTLLLWNAVAMEALPIFLEHLMSAWAAIFLSVTFILLFGEVIPQALCSRFGLAIGAYTRFIVWALIFVSFPVSWPISKILDWVIGENHGTKFRRAELKELITMHQQLDEMTEEEEDGEFHNRDGLSIDEVTIIRGALDLKNKSVKTCICKLDDCYMLDITGTITKKKLEEILDVGHSRIPVYRGTKEFIVGMILVKTLILINPEAETPVEKLNIRRLPTVAASLPLYNMLNIFQTGKSHMAIILDDKDGMTPLGVITLEDVIEELIQEPIEDESDYLRMSGQKPHLFKQLISRYSIDGGSRPMSRSNSAEPAVELISTDSVNIN